MSRSKKNAFEKVQEYSNAVRQAVSLGDECWNYYGSSTSNLCSIAHADEVGELWLPVPGLCTSTYGADANTHNMITTNEEAATELADERKVEWGCIRTYFALQVIDEECNVSTDALALLTELVESLESYPLLNEDTYSQACWEQAAEEADSEIMDASRKLIASDKNIADRIADDFGDDVADEQDTFLAKISEEAKDALWDEEECWPVIQTEVLRAAIIAAYPAKDPNNWTRCTQTIEMF